MPRDYAKTGPSGKLTHQAVGYEKAKPGGDCCDECTHWSGENQCSIVEPPNAPDGWCRRFKRE